MLLHSHLSLEKNALCNVHQKTLAFQGLRKLHIKLIFTAKTDLIIWNVVQSSK